MVSSSMIATPVSYPHLRLDDKGRPWVVGANVKVIEIAADYLAHRSSVEEMAYQFPHLTPSMIHSALAYFYDHREEMEGEINRSLNSYLKELQADRNSPLHRRLREAAEIGK